MTHHVFRYGGEFAELIIERAEGAYVYGADGRPVLDFTSGQMSAILGHSHPEIVATVRDAIADVDHVHSSFLSTPVLQLAEALTAILPKALSKVLPLSTGGESNEAALRMAKMTTGGFEVVAFDRSWHGVTGGAAASTYRVSVRPVRSVAPGPTKAVCTATGIRIGVLENSCWRSALRATYTTRASRRWFSQHATATLTE